MKTKVFFITIITFLFISSAPLAQADEDDTCEVLSFESVLAYSHVKVGVRVFTDSPDWIQAVVIPLTWNFVTTDIICDSIHWSDWFWNNEPTTYSGGPGRENYIDSVAQEIEIMAIWTWSPYLPPDDTILATIHFTIGELDLTEPNGGEEWMVGDGRTIRWSAKCDWEVNDSVVIDSFCLETTQEDYTCVNFSDTLGAPIGTRTIISEEDTLYDLEFKKGYLTRAPADLDSVMIEYSFDAGRTWNVIVSSFPNNSEYSWSPIPDTPSDSCLIRITSKAENPISVVSDGFFSILAETTEVKEEKKEPGFPATFVLYQNYPNPFNPSTKIEFSLPERAQVKLEIYNISGKRVKRLVDEELPSGQWSVVWNGEDDEGREVASGVYLYRLKTCQFTQTKKMVLVR